MSLPGPGSESVDLGKLLPSVGSCLPMGCPSSGRISRNLPWTAHACSPPYRLNRSEDPSRVWIALRSTAENGARCRGISAVADCCWEEEIARRETHRHKEKCSR